MRAIAVPASFAIAMTRDHSAWMLATDTFSHTGAGGSSPGDRMAHAGYAFTGSWTWGENIAIQWGGGTGITAGQVQSFHDGLFRGAGHRQNILQDAFKEVGIGLATGRAVAGGIGTMEGYFEIWSPGEWEKAEAEMKATVGEVGEGFGEAD